MDFYVELKSLGYTIESLEQIVLELYQIEKEALYSKSRQKMCAEDRSIFCYWVVRELGLEGTRMAKRLNMRQPGVAYAVKKGKKIVKTNNLQMIE